ncbi:uncharacterized protein CIMG_12724 [Coccidioides immitis RS]|uniref:Uncharacterized protein n=1 Tax=Coccidioides immitis (strain RS) TaxID=246410 RepID=A0A0D8JUW2_COCIM|nr:uncharacterized protein CIMG_12724 [Coccidioides immitis RS]KJF60073.1 hypothetical protein CIMG_12724 [Coccidioides immitis RS]
MATSKSSLSTWDVTRLLVVRTGQFPYRCLSSVNTLLAPQVQMDKVFKKGGKFIGVEQDIGPVFCRFLPATVSTYTHEPDRLS